MLLFLILKIIFFELTKKLLGDLVAATDRAILENFKISDIVTVNNDPLPASITSLPHICCYYIEGKVIFTCQFSNFLKVNTKKSHLELVNVSIVSLAYSFFY